MPYSQKLLLIIPLRRYTVLSLSMFITHGELGISVVIGNFEVDRGYIPTRIVYRYGSLIWS